MSLDMNSNENLVPAAPKEADKQQLPLRAWDEFLMQENLLSKKFKLFADLKDDYEALLFRTTQDKNIANVFHHLINMPKQLILASLNDKTSQSEGEKFFEQVEIIYTLIVGSVQSSSGSKNNPVRESVVFEKTFVASVFEITRLNPIFDSYISTIENLCQPMVSSIKKTDPEKAEQVFRALKEVNITNANTVTYLEFLRTMLILPTQHLQRYALLFETIIRDTIGYPKEKKLLEAIREKLIELTIKVDAEQVRKLTAKDFSCESKSRLVADIPKNTIDFLAYTLLASQHFPDTIVFFKELYQATINTFLNFNTPGIIDALVEKVNTGPNHSDFNALWNSWKLWLTNIRDKNLTTDDSIANIRKEVIIKQSHGDAGITIFEKGKEKNFLYQTMLEFAIAILKKSPVYIEDYLQLNADKRRSILPIKDISSAAIYGWSSLKAKSQNKTLSILPGLRIQALITKLAYLKVLTAEEIDKLIKKLHPPFIKDIRGLITKKIWESLSFFDQPLAYEVNLSEFEKQFMQNNTDLQFVRKNFTSVYVDRHAKSKNHKNEHDKKSLALLNILTVVEKIIRIYTEIICKDLSPNSSSSLTALNFAAMFQSLTPQNIWRELSPLFEIADKAMSMLLVTQINNIKPSVKDELWNELIKLVKQFELPNLKEKIAWLTPCLQVLLCEDGNQSFTSLKQVPNYIKFHTQITPNGVEMQIHRYLIIRTYAFLFEYMFYSTIDLKILNPEASIKYRYVDHICSVLQELYSMSLTARKSLISVLDQKSIIGLIQFIFSGFIMPKVSLIPRGPINDLVSQLQALNQECGRQLNVADPKRLEKLSQILLGEDYVDKNKRIIRSIEQFLILLSYRFDFITRADEIKSNAMQQDGLTATLTRIETYLNKMTVAAIPTQTSQLNKHG